MKRSCLVIILLLILSVAYSQNFSNKGKDFWLGYGYHVSMAGNPSGGGSQDMVLYFTSDKNANVTVNIPSNGYTATYSVTANQVTVSNPLPKAGSSDARIYDTGYYNRGIHITSDADIVAYAHIYNQNVSGASLLFPTNTLGKDYYVISYNQSSNSNSANSFAFVVAVETGITQVEITPSVTNKNGRVAGVPFTVNLTQGQVYSLMGITSGLTGTDLTGTRIRSISSAGSCKKIAVFCGTGKISIGANSSGGNNQTGSGDNLFAQAVPATAWGLRYLTSPTTSQPSNYYRICVADPTTVVKVNGSVISTSYLQRGFFYELKNSTPLTTPGNGIGQANTSTGVWNLIEADKPINVAQFCTTQADDGNPNLSTGGDPEMIYLSPVEQTINSITLYSATKYQILQSFINVIIKKGGTNSFTLDGVSKTSSFLPHPQDPNYYYASFPVTSPNSHTLYSDTGFNAIAYGFGSAESYGYNAGTNIKSLYTPVFQNPYARLSFAATCVGTPFQFSVPLSYQPTSLTWDFGNNANLTPNAQIGPLTPPTYDSAIVIGGQNLYYYSPANGAAGGKTFTYLNSGTDTIKMYVTNPTPDGCGATNAEYDIPVLITNVPTANYSLPPTICISDSIQFKDASSNLGTSTVVTGLWTWGDGTTDSLFNPKHKYLLPNTYNIRYRPITNYGCIGDTTIPLTIDATAIAKFGYSDSCIGRTIIFTDSSTIASGTIAKWYWDYGDGTKDTLTTNANRTKIYNATGTYNVTLIVENATGCKSNPYTIPITIRPNAVVNFGIPSVVCLPIGAAQFTDSSTIADGTAATFKYQWSFGDGGIDSVKNPIHNYTATGSYNVKLIVKSQYGCLKDSTKQLVNIYTQPQVGFTVSPQVCLRDTTIVLTTQFSETGPSGATLTPTKYFWNFGDGSTDTVAYPKHKYAAKGVDTIKYWVISNVGCMSDTAIQTTIVNPLPTANFITTAINNYCENKPITFTDKATDSSITTGVSINNWYWNMGNGTTLTPTGGFNTNFNQYYNAYGIYNVKMAVQNSIGCKSDTLTQAVTVNPQPHVGFIIPDVCLADALAVFTDTSTIANSNTIISHLWNFNAGSPAISPGPTLTTPTAQNGSAHYNTVGNYIVSLKLISNNGCDTTLAQPFIVNGSIPNAQFTIIKPNNLCSNDSVRIIDASTVDFGNVTKNEIFWDLISAPAADSIDNNPSPQTSKQYAHLYNNFQTPATKTYSVKMIAHSGNSSVCQNSVTKIITLNQSPKVQFTTIPGICNDTTTRLITQASEIGGVPGSYAFYGTGVSSNGTYTPQAVAAGTYPIKYVYTSPIGCADSATKNITVWPSPVAKWGVSSPLCEKNAVAFTDSSIANYSNIINRYWSFGDNNTAVYSNTTLFNYTYASAASYTASLRVVTDSGCRSTYNTQVLKINYLPAVNFGLPSICLPDGRGTFTDSSTIGDGTQALFSYMWNFGDVNDATPSTLKNPTHKYIALGPYTVQLKVTTSAGCIDSITKQLTTVYPQPKASFTATPDTICYGSIIQFIDNSNGITSAAQKWYWDLSGGTTSNLQTPNKKFVDTGMFNISLYIYNAQNCVSDTAVKQVVVYPYPVLNIGPSLFVLQGGTVTIKPPYIYGHNLQYVWTPNNFLDSPTIANPHATPTDDITYKLTLTGDGGCAVNDNVFIKVLKAPTVPNAFSPNGDGINDTWVIKYLESYPGATVDVYDRSGQPVFHASGTVQWDGTLNGKPLPVGTYYYIVDPKNGRAKISGSVTIIR
ncbi:MAG: PKD domain-containing protein [Bacteroidetes bacterium]|nr:PKD domain-containing protein [Bacteroidota bacterium]MBS1670159.1 PKD domain-containing protein [Bacteroidota bacterium]